MNNKLSKISNLTQYKLVLKKFDWDELAFDLIKLEEELGNLQNYLKPKEIKTLQKLISLYEEEKISRIPKTTAYLEKIQSKRDLIAISEEDDIAF